MKTLEAKLLNLHRELSRLQGRFENNLDVYYTLGRLSGVARDCLALVTLETYPLVCQACGGSASVKGERHGDAEIMTATCTELNCGRKLPVGVR